MVPAALVDLAVPDQAVRVDLAVPDLAALVDLADLGVPVLD